MKTLKNNAWLGLLALALAACVTGCSSDSVTPNEDIPAVTAEGSAGTAVAISLAMTQVGPYILDPFKAVEDITISGDDVNGTVHIDFRDGPDGNPAEAGVAAWAHLYTDAGSPVVVNVLEYGGQAAFDLDVTGSITRTPDTVTILAGSGGSMTSGDRTTTFTVDGLIIDGGSYPAAGTVNIVPDDGPTASVTFDGSNIARAVVGMAMYDVNLDTGAVTDAVVPI
ncbi:MAG: hypothetical protein GY838_03385 [bacterium]|nr:hypothetical protein [bacterium]